MHRRRLLTLLTAALLAVPTAAHALGPGATGLQVGDVLTVSESEEGGATGLEVLGQEVTGTDGDGETALLSTEDLGVPGDVVEVEVLRTEVDGEESSADALAVTIGGDEGAEVTAISSERDGEGAATSGATVAGGGESLELLTTASRGGEGEVVVIDVAGNQLGGEQLGSEGCDIPLPVLIDGQMTCAEAGEDGDEAVILGDLTVQELSDATGLSVDLLRANGAADGPDVTPPSPDPTPEGPDPDPTPEEPTGPATPTGGPDGPATPEKTKTPTVGGPGAPLGAPASGGGQLANAGAPALALLALGSGLLGTGGLLLRRRD